MKRLIDFETMDGKSLLIDADSIVALREDSKETTKIYCQGVQEPFVVASSLFHIYVKLTKLGIGDLVKPETANMQKEPVNPN